MLRVELEDFEGNKRFATKTTQRLSCSNHLTHKSLAIFPLQPLFPGTDFAIDNRDNTDKKFFFLADKTYVSSIRF